MLKGCLISGLTEFSNHKMSRLCQTPEAESQGAKGISLTGSPSQAGTFESSLGGYMNTIIRGKIKVQTHRSLSLILLKVLSWFHTTDSWISCSSFLLFYFFPPLRTHFHMSYRCKPRTAHQPHCFHTFWFGLSGKQKPSVLDRRIDEMTSIKWG